MPVVSRAAGKTTAIAETCGCANRSRVAQMPKVRAVNRSQAMIPKAFLLTSRLSEWVDLRQTCLCVAKMNLGDTRYAATSLLSLPSNDSRVGLPSTTVSRCTGRPHSL